MTNQEIIDNLKFKHNWLNDLEPDKIDVIIEMLIMAYGEGFADGYEDGYKYMETLCMNEITDRGGFNQ